MPEGHFTVMANNFIMRGVDCSDADFECGTHVDATARKFGTWEGTAEAPNLIDFSKSYALRKVTFYGPGRMRRVASLFSKDDIPLSRDQFVYPFSYPVHTKLSVRRLMDAMLVPRKAGGPRRGGRSSHHPP